MLFLQITLSKQLVGDIMGTRNTQIGQWQIVEAIEPKGSPFCGLEKAVNDFLLLKDWKMSPFDEIDTGKPFDEIQIFQHAEDSTIFKSLGRTLTFLQIVKILEYRTTESRTFNFALDLNKVHQNNLPSKIRNNQSDYSLRASFGRWSAFPYYVHVIEAEGQKYPFDNVSNLKVIPKCEQHRLLYTLNKKDSKRLWTSGCLF